MLKKFFQNFFLKPYEEKIKDHPLIESNFFPGIYLQNCSRSKSMKNPLPQGRGHRWGGVWGTYPLYYPSM